MEFTGNDKVVKLPKRVELSLAMKPRAALSDLDREGAEPAVFSLHETAPTERKEDPEEGFSKPREVKRLTYIHIDAIRFNKYQTREITGEDEIESLARSIVQKGVLQPVLVRPLDHPGEEEKPFELIAGERRLRAAARAGLNVIPAIVQELNDREAVELSIIENAQRENLNPIEEAFAYRYLADDFGLTQAEIAQAAGKSRVAISNSLRLLQLDSRVVDLLKSEELTAGHGRALLMLAEADRQWQFAKRAVRSKLSVHALERLISRFLDDEEDEPPSAEELQEQESLKRQQTKIEKFLGIEQVSLNLDSAGKKRLNLVFESEASWKRFMGKIRE